MCRRGGVISPQGGSEIISTRRAILALSWNKRALLVCACPNRDSVIGKPSQRVGEWLLFYKVWFCDATPLPRYG